MRVLVILVSLIANIALGYYVYTFNQTILQRNAQINKLKSDARIQEGNIADKNNEISTLSQRVSDGENRISVLQGNLTQKDSQINTLSSRLSKVMCYRTIDGSLLSGKYTRDQVGRVIQTWYEDNYPAVIYDVEYSDNLYNNKNDFRMRIYFTSRDDSKRYSEVLTVSYKLYQADSSYQPENDSVIFVAFNDCVAFAD